MRQQKGPLPYYFLAPALAVLAVVILYPVLGNVYMSLHKVRLLGRGGDEFVGLFHYARLASSRAFLGSIGSSLKFSLISLPLALVLGLALALVFNEIRRCRPVFTGFLLVPWAIAPVATSPPIALFVSLQKYFVRGLTAGAVKQ